MKNDYYLKNYKFYKNTTLITALISLVLGILSINKAIFGNLYETTAYILNAAGIGFIIVSITLLKLSDSYSKTIKMIKNSI